MTPINKNIIVKPIEEKKDNTILMPDTTQGKSSSGVVLSVSAEVKSVKVGDVVHWPAFLGVELNYKEQKIIVLEESDISFIE